MAAPVQSLSAMPHVQMRRRAKHKARSSRLLETLNARQNQRCYWCGELMVMRAFFDAQGKQIADPHKATVDHVVALTAGGATDDKNCVAACHDCNQLRAEHNTGLWRKQMTRMGEQLREQKRQVSELVRWMERRREESRAKDDLIALQAETLMMPTQTANLWTRLMVWLGGRA